MMFPKLVHLFLGSELNTARVVGVQGPHFQGGLTLVPLDLEPQLFPHSVCAATSSSEKTTIVHNTTGYRFGVAQTSTKHSR